MPTRPPSRTSASSGRWMTIEEFCEELNVSRGVAYKWSAAGPASGRFPKFRKLPNGRIRIRRDWFEEWIDRLEPST